MKSEADSIQPPAPSPSRQTAAPSASQKPKKKSTSTDNIHDLTQALKNVSIKPHPAKGDHRPGTSPELPQGSRKAQAQSPDAQQAAYWWLRTRGRTPEGIPFTPRQKSAITMPSEASGGVPEPTEAYLAASLEPVRRLSEPQHLLLVIDLNGTLLFRPNKRDAVTFIERPYTPRFVKYCVETFRVVIWSSARPDNVESMAQNILGLQDREAKVVAIWGRDKFGLSRADYMARTQCYKRLTKLWADDHIAKSHPAYETGGRWDHTNTVLVDDSTEKARSEPFNAIVVPEFCGDVNEPGQILPQVHDCLNNLSMHSNVAAYLRAHPFKVALPDSLTIESEL